MGVRGGWSVAGEGPASSPAPAPSASVALVEVNDENIKTAAGVLGGLVGLLIGGVFVGGALFTILSYLARQKDDDVSKAVKGVAAGSLEALNYVANLNNKYAVTDKVGDAITGAVEGAKSNPESKEVVSTVSTVLDGVGGSVKAFDKEVGIKTTLGSVLVSGSKLATDALQKAVDLNKEYKVTDQIKEKIAEVTKGQ